MFKNITVFMLLLIFAGCLSFGFKTERKSLFSDINNNKVYVEYTTEKHTETLPNGAELSFDRKIRLTLPDGKRIVLYQTISVSGVRYHTLDNEFIFIERGPWCKIIRNRAIVYQGIFRKNCSID